MTAREVCFIGAAFLSGLSGYATAGLGGAATQVPAATSAASAQVKVMQRPAAIDRYTVTEIRNPAGGVIKEYVSAAGIVFAISWQSPIMPDLHQILGEYFPSFERAAVASRSTGRRGPLNINQADLVMQSGGRMRDFRGRAYDPGLLPPNVAAEEIQ